MLCLVPPHKGEGQESARLGSRFVARMSAAISGALSAIVPAYRVAHAGYDGGLSGFVWPPGDLARHRRSLMLFGISEISLDASVEAGIERSGPVPQRGGSRSSRTRDGMRWTLRCY